MKKLILFLFVSLFLCSCSSGGSGGDDDSEFEGGETPEQAQAPRAEDVVRPFRVLSFNAGLLPSFVPLADQRVAPIASALAGLDTEILCLQEVWRSSDQAALSSALGGAFPFMATVAPRQQLSSTAPPCQLSSFEPLLGCIIDRCLFSGRDIVECSAAECSPEVFSLADEDPECAAAVFAQAGRSVSEVFALQDELLTGGRPAGLFAFGGSSGLMLFSKLPLADIQILDFFNITTTSRRAAIFARVEINGLQQNIGCTHLTSNLEGVLPYTGESGSWENEARAQASRMVDFAESYGGGGPLLLAGDFNCSVSNGATGANADFASVCQRFQGNGYRDFIGESISCSYCQNNSLLQLGSVANQGGNFLLDHVFTRDLLFAPQAAQLELTQIISAGGAAVNLSDHYGVKLTVPVPGP